MWRVYYDNGSTWNYTQGTDNMPQEGVICILQNRERYHIAYGAPYYALHDDEWLHFHENDMVDYLIHGIPIDKLIIGRMVTKATFNKVFEIAQRDKNAENL